jgi:pilus assembly protein Flp/PilA
LATRDLGFLWSQGLSIEVVERAWRKSHQGAQIMLRRFRAFLKSDDGPTAVEYAVLLSLIVGACLASVGTLAEAMRDSFNSSGTTINNALNAST